MAVIQTLECRGIETRAVIVHGTMPFPKTTDFSRVALRDPIFGYRPTEVQIIGETPNWYICELSAHINRFGSTGGTITFPIEDVVPPSLADVGAQGIYQEEINLCEQGGILMKLHDASGGVHTIDLGLPTIWDTFHRNNDLRRTYRRFADVGAFGSLVWYLTIDAHRHEVFLDIDWNNATGLGRAHVVFRGVELALPANYAWGARTPEDLTYDEPNKYIVRDSGVNHAIFTRYCTPLRVTIRNTNFLPVHNRTGVGWGAGDWSKGGFYPADWKIAKTLPSDMASRAATEAANLQPLVGSPSEGPGTPINYLYPGYFIQYGGGTSGNLLWSASGMSGAAKPDLGVLKFFWIAQRRDMSRQYGYLFDELRGGESVYPKDARWLLANGQADWNMYDFDFLNSGSTVTDGNWNWEPFTNADPVPTVTYTAQLLGTLTSGRRGFNATSGWDPHDTQHLIRHLRLQAALVWLDWDPLAWHYLQALSNLMWMSYWDGTGRAAGRFNIPAVAGQGGQEGRALHWATQCRAHHYVFASPTVRADMKSWFRRAADIHEKNKMPCGLVHWSQGKISEDPPFNYLWAAGRFNEQTYLAKDLNTIAVLLADDPVTAAKARAVSVSQVSALWDYVWEFAHVNGVEDLSQPRTGMWDATPVATAFNNNGIVTPISFLSSRSEWPASLVIAMDSVFFTAADVVAPAIEFMYRRVGDVARSANMLGSWLALYPSTDFNAFRDRMRTWGPIAPNQQTTPYVDQWGMLLSYLENPDVPSDGGSLIARAQPATVDAIGTVKKTGIINARAQAANVDATGSVTKIGTLNARAQAARVVAFGAIIHNGVLNAQASPATVDGTADFGSMSGTLTAIAQPATVVGAVQMGHVGQLIAVSAPATVNGFADTDGDGMLHAHAQMATVTGALQVVKIGNILALASPATVDGNAENFKDGALHAFASNATVHGTGSAGNPSKPGPKFISIEVQRVTPIDVIKKNLMIDFEGGGASILAALALRVFDSDDTDYLIRLYKPANLLVEDSDGSQITLATDGVNLQAFDTNGSPVFLPIDQL